MAGVFQAVLRFGGLTMVSRVTGFLRNMVLTAALGRSAFADSYLLANTIPNIIYENVMGGLVSALLLPRIVDAQKLHGRNSPGAWSAASQLLWGVTTVLFGFAILGSLLAPQIIEFMTAYAGENRQPDREVAIRFLTFFAWQIPFYGMNAVLMAILNSHDRFSLTAAAPIVNNCVATVAIGGYSLGYWGADGLALGTTLGVAAMALIQFPSVLRLGMPLIPGFSLSHPVFQGLGRLSWPILVTSLVGLIGVSIRNNLLYSDPGGTVTFTLCFQVFMTPYGILAVPIATVLYPAMARAAAERDFYSLGQTVRTAIGATMAVTLPVSLGIFLLAEPLVRVLFERGAFLAGDTWVTARFLSIYALALVPHSLVIFLTRPYFSLGDTKTPAALQVGSLFLSLAVGWFLMPYHGIHGLAVGAIVGNTVGCLLGLFLLSRRLGSEVAWKGFPTGLLRLLGAAGISAVVVGTIIHSAASPHNRLVHRINSSDLPPTSPFSPVKAQTPDFRALTATEWQQLWNQARPTQQWPQPLVPGGSPHHLSLVWLSPQDGKLTGFQVTELPDIPVGSTRMSFQRAIDPKDSGSTISQGIVIQTSQPLPSDLLFQFPELETVRTRAPLWVPLLWLVLGGGTLLALYAFLAWTWKAEGSDWVRARLIKGRGRAAKGPGSPGESVSD